MKLSDIADILSATGLPVAFDHFNDAQALPFIVYLVAGNQSEPAEDAQWHMIEEIQVELYSKEKSTSLEETVESALADFYFEKSEGYLIDEQMYMVTYQFLLY